MDVLRMTKPNHRQRVFISGVRREFTRERLELASLLAEYGAEPIVFERMVAPDGSLLLRALDDAISKSDLFIGIYGSEYSSSTTSRPSNIEMELTSAIEYGIPCALFVLTAPEQQRDPNLTDLINRYSSRALVTTRHIPTRRDLLGEVRQTLPSLLARTSPQAAPSATYAASRGGNSKHRNRIRLKAKNAGGPRARSKRVRRTDRGSYGEAGIDLTDVDAAPNTADRVELAIRLLSDMPSNVDLLGFDDYAQAIVDFLSSEHTTKPITIGIDAPWGMGKSTLMQMIRKKLSTPTAISSEESKGFSFLPSRRNTEGVFPTVWFNAWKYHNEESVWAALAMTIVNDLKAHMSMWEEAKLWFRINSKRIDAPTKLWVFLKTAAITAFVVAAIGIVISAFAMLKGRSFDELVGGMQGFIAGFAVLISLSSAAIATTRQFGMPLDVLVGNYLRTSKYSEKVGFVADFGHDFETMVTTATKGGKWPIVIFIDDLDRCSPTDTVEIIEALNQLFDSDHCIFILGMDMSTVSRSVEIKYKDLAEQITSTSSHNGLGFGRRFVEKIVQVEFRIPPTDKKTIDSFTRNALSGIPVDIGVEVHTPIQQATEDAARLMAAEQRSNTNLSTDAAADLLTSMYSTEVLERAKSELYARSFDDDPVVLESIIEVVPYLENNPRKIKRFINALRLQALILYRRGIISSRSEEIMLVAKCVLIAMQWPKISKAIMDHDDISSHLDDARWVLEKMKQEENSYDERLNTYHNIDPADRDQSELPNSAEVSQTAVALRSTLRDPLALLLASSPEIVRLLDDVSPEELAALPGFLRLTAATA